MSNLLDLDDVVDTDDHGVLGHDRTVPCGQHRVDRNAVQPQDIHQRLAGRRDSVVDS